MDLEYVWGAECGDCGTRILRSDVRVGCTLDEWLGAHKETTCFARAQPRVGSWPKSRGSVTR